MKYISVPHSFIQNCKFNFNKTHWHCDSAPGLGWTWQKFFSEKTGLPNNDDIKYIYQTYVPIFDTPIIELICEVHKN